MSEKKSLKKNYIYNTSYQLLAIIAPLITTPFIARVLGAEGVGIYNYVYSFAYVFSLIGALGTKAYAQREIACLQGDIRKRSKLFMEVMVIKLISIACVSTVYFIIAFNSEKYRNYMPAAYFYILASLFDISWLFQGMEDFKTTVLRNFIIKLLGIVLVFILIRSSEDVIKYILILGISMLAGQLYMWFYLPRVVKLERFDDLNVVQHLKPTLILFLPAMATYVYTTLDKLMLGRLTTNAEVGFYSQSEKIVKLLLTIITSLGTVLVPRMARLIRSGEWKEVGGYFNKSVRFVLALSIPMVFGLICTADQFIPIFLGSGYEKSIFLLQLLSPLIIIIGLASVTGQAMLVSMGKQTYYTITVLSGAIVNFCVNWMLIPRIQSVGASIATLIAECIVTTMQIIGIRKVIDFKVVLKSNYRYLLVGSAMFACLEMLKKLIVPMMPSYVVLGVLVLVGGLLYAFLLHVTNDPFEQEVRNMIRKRIKRN